MRPCSVQPLLWAAFLLGLGGCGGPARAPEAATDVPTSSAAAAETCAVALPPAASIIYRDALPDVHAETNMETLLRTKVFLLIVRGNIRRGEARPAAERAAECLEMLQH